MCGIDTEVAFLPGQGFFGRGSPVSDAIQRRGPDGYHVIKYKASERCVVHLSSSILHLRGMSRTRQPLESANFILQWNGEIYAGINVPLHENDTSVLLATLETDSSSPIEQIISRINGEFAFVLLDKQNNHLYYGRDVFGRRSLVIANKAGRVRLTSVVPSVDGGLGEFEEVPADGIYHVDLSKDEEGWSPRQISWPQTKIVRISRSLDISSFVSERVLEETIERLRASISRRVMSIPHILEDPESSPARLAILFSGGIDSVILSIIVDQCLPSSCSIDLINVAFRNDRFLRQQKSQDLDNNAFNVPDRVSGLRAREELCRLSPHRQWNFVAANVTLEEYYAHRAHVASLMRPSRSVMDLSIAMALWFAARGQGTLIDASLHTSQAKVLLVGMGADEQLGGYARHRTAFEFRNGHVGVAEEIQRELDRISSRNLGRDDRCISDHGKEARFPFLDEDFVNYLSSLPIPLKCDLSQPRGHGEKMIFRKIAKHFGFSDVVAFLPKRAIQFGAKTAKLEDNSNEGDALIEI